MNIHVTFQTCIFTSKIIFLEFKWREFDSRSFIWFVGKGTLKIAEQTKSNSSNQVIKLGFVTHFMPLVFLFPLKTSENF